MFKVSIFQSALLLTSCLIIISSIIGETNVLAKPASSNEYQKGLKASTDMLMAILNNHYFLTLSYPEQFKVLDEFYNHVNIFLKEEEDEENEKEKQEE